MAELARVAYRRYMNIVGQMRRLLLAMATMAMVFVREAETLVVGGLPRRPVFVR